MLVFINEELNPRHRMVSRNHEMILTLTSLRAQHGRTTSKGVYLRDVPHVDAASPCASTCPVSQGSGGGVFVNDNEEQRAIEHRSIEQRSKPGSSDRRMTNKSPVAATGRLATIATIASYKY